LESSIRNTATHTPEHFALLDDALVLSLSSYGESSFMIVQTSADDGIFVLASWVGEHEYLSSALSFNFHNAALNDNDIISDIVFAFSCGRCNCVVHNNGTIIASSGSTGSVLFHEASIAAVNAFVLDPRCSSGIMKYRSVFAVRDAWMSDGEVILHWGSGCYNALEVLMDLPVPRVLISWAACVGTDIPRTTGTIQVYLGHGTFAVVSPMVESSPACVGDAALVPRHLITDSMTSMCNATASSAFKFSDLSVETFYGELFLKNNNETLESPAFSLALFKIPWRQQLSGPARHISDSNISLIPNADQTRPLCQLTGVIATTGFLCCLSSIVRYFTCCFRSSVSTTCWNVQ
jgi:hypothetical protein